MLLFTSYYSGDLMKQFALIFMASVLLVHSMSAMQANIILGGVQFPKSIGKLPPLRIYHCGRIIKTEKDLASKKIIFQIPKGSYQSHFFILVCDSVEFVTRNSNKTELHDNTIAYLKVDTQKSYKLYSVLLAPHEAHNEAEPAHIFLNKEKINYSWHIQEKALDSSGRIPDDTLIISYPADSIDFLRPESMFELPTIIIKENVLELLGSTQLAELSDKLIIESLHLDALHVQGQQPKQIVKQPARRIILPELVA